MTLKEKGSTKKVKVHDHEKQRINREQQKLKTMKQREDQPGRIEVHDHKRKKTCKTHVDHMNYKP